MEITKSAVDIGIVTRDAEPMVAFYRDVLGLQPEGVLELPGTGTQHRFHCGDSLIKIIETSPKADAAPGGIRGASGYRYYTICVASVADVADACRDAGRRVVVEPMEIRPGISICMVEDPDGNWVEFLQT